MQTNPHQAPEITDATITKLQECLRTELSAVETYELALKSVTHVGLHHALQEILTSHGRRTDQLRDRILRLGAEPVTSSGVWGAFAKVFQAGADLLGDRTAIAALEEGEDRSLHLYKTSLNEFDGATRMLIAREILPAAQRSHDLCRTLKSYVNAPS